MTQNLDETIRIALSQPVTSQEAREALDAARDRLSKMEGEKAAARARALDPLIDPAGVAEARNRAADLDFEHDRLTAAVTKLTLRVAQLREAEAVTAAASHYAEVKAERDAVAALISERYPALLAELTEILRRLKASDENLPMANVGKGGESYLHSADEIARGSFVRGGVRHTSWPGLTDARLPPATAGSEWAWPLAVGR